MLATRAHQVILVKESVLLCKFYTLRDGFPVDTGEKIDVGPACFEVFQK